MANDVLARLAVQIDAKTSEFGSALKLLRHRFQIQELKAKHPG